MNFFAVYDPASGAIRRAGWCRLAADLAREAQAGEAVIAHTVLPRDDAFRVDVTKTPHQVVAKAA